MRLIQNEGTQNAIETLNKLKISNNGYLNYADTLHDKVQLHFLNGEENFLTLMEAIY